MNIEKLARVALDFLKTKETNFPKHGVIAGGSLGNLIWEQVSGNVAVVNDIDIFIFDREINSENVYGDNTNTTDNKKIFYRSLEKIYYKDDDEKSIVEITNEGYQNEMMQTSDNLKTGDYISQFNEIDFEKMPKSNSQIGFNPKPKEDKFDLPYANVNVEYLLSK